MVRRILLVAGLLWAGAALAVDGYSLDAGSGHDGVKIVRLSTSLRQWEQLQKQDKSRACCGWNMHVQWELGIAYWRAQENTAGVQDLFDISATPVLRFSIAREVPRPYADLGIGVHLLTEHRIGERELSTPYHFGSLAGLGIELDHGLDLSLRFQHLSNASVDLPNPGINFALLCVAVRY